MEAHGRAFECVVIGGGIVGLATARELLRRRPGMRLALLEKEPQLAFHQTGHNSGVIHSGVYYRPGSLKARLCVEGRNLLLQFCESHGIAFRITGKLIVATRPRELPALDDILSRGRANGVPGLGIIGPDEMREFEPNARGLRAVRVPSAGVVDYRTVAQAIAAEIVQAGGEIRLGEEVRHVEQRPSSLVLTTALGVLETRRLVGCAGLQSDRLAGPLADSQELRIIPFRGDYYLLRPQARHLVRSLIYPVPDSRFPFLGVHFARHLDGSVSAGPNAVLAFAREKYGPFDIHRADVLSTVTWPGFWRLVRRHWIKGAVELWRDHNRVAYLGQLQRILPELTVEDLLPGPSGIRAQAVARDGALLDDFRIGVAGTAFHVLNAPSPAATSSFAIAQAIADRADEAWRG